MKRIVILMLFSACSHHLFGQHKKKAQVASTCNASTPDDYRQLIVKYKQVIDKHPNDENALNQLGMSYFSLLDHKNAIIYFSRLIALNPHYPGAYSNRSICRLMLKDKEGMCADLKGAIAIGDGKEKIMDGKSISEYVAEQCDK